MVRGTEGALGAVLGSVRAVGGVTNEVDDPLGLFGNSSGVLKDPPSGVLFVLLCAVEDGIGIEKSDVFGERGVGVMLNNDLGGVSNGIPGDADSVGMLALNIDADP